MYKLEGYYCNIISLRNMCCVFTILIVSLLVLGLINTNASASSIGYSFSPEEVFPPGTLPPNLAQYEQDLDTLRRINSKITNAGLEYDRVKYTNSNRAAELYDYINKLKQRRQQIRSQLPTQLQPTPVELYGAAQEEFDRNKAINWLREDPNRAGKTYYMWLKDGKWQGGPNKPTHGYDPIIPIGGGNTGGGGGTGGGSSLPPCMCRDSAGRGFRPALGLDCASATSDAMRDYNCS
ncbi:MAG: hypothetical protein KC473_09445 [Candidatus Dadabacteria bacterium]|nr:hypothetical protein [Candidatus Dadabacteria bacterium]